MMKILVFGITQNPGGVESFIMNYYRKLDRSRVQFDFLCNTQTVAYEDEIASLGGKIFKITQRSQNPQKYKKDMDEFFSQNAKNYSAIWVNVCSLANIDYLKYAKKYKIKTRIIHSHNTQNMDSFLRGILHKINRLFISKYANHFFACTELAGEWFYSKKIRASKNYRLIPNAIDTEKFLFSEKARCELREEWNIENELVIGNIGRLHSQKNQGFLLEIFSEILKKRDARLVICGDGEEKENLQNKADALGISDKTLFLGVRSDVQRLYSAFDVFLLPSLYEGLGIVLIEAQASGLPSFASAEVIPEDARVSEQLKFIPLEKSPALWAEEILNSNLSRKNNTQADIINKGYDINSQIDMLQKFFETEV